MADLFSAESRLIARQSAIALAIAGHLAGHPRVAAVHYPGVGKRTSELARRQTAPAGLIRPSVGVEPAMDLITDNDQALEVL